MRSSRSKFLFTLVAPLFACASERLVHDDFCLVLVLVNAAPTHRLTPYSPRVPPYVFSDSPSMISANVAVALSHTHSHLPISPSPTIIPMPTTIRTSCRFGRKAIIASLYVGICNIPLTNVQSPAKEWSLVREFHREEEAISRNLMATLLPGTICYCAPRNLNDIASDGVFVY